MFCGARQGRGIVCGLLTFFAVLCGQAYQGGDIRSRGRAGMRGLVSGFWRCCQPASGNAPGLA